jgi:ribonuclease Z
MELVFLGTGAGMPSKERNVTSIALTLYDERGTFWLFDCGEGTQHQMLRSPLKPSKLEFVFITHLHGDHLYGLPGMLTSRSYQGGESPLTVFGPPGVREWIESTLRLSQARLTYELTVQEVEEGTVFADERFEVSAVRLDHRIESFGYRIAERGKPGRLDVEKLKRLGVQPGPVYGQLKNGETVRLPDGRLIDGKSCVGPPIPGRTVVIAGDTKACEATVRLARDADVLVHEATFAGDLEQLADKYYHSTALGAARIAAEANVKTLIMTHVSSRYPDEQAERLVEEARTIVPDVHLASDFWTYRIP